MSESKAIGIRLENNFLERVEALIKEEHFDRSTIMRVLLEEGYASYIMKKAAEEYISGKTTISKAAEKARATVWEFEQFLVSRGFKSQYSTEDLKEEIKKIKK